MYIGIDLTPGGQNEEKFCIRDDCSVCLLKLSGQGQGVGGGHE